jgi:hypothetical protein
MLFAIVDLKELEVLGYRWQLLLLGRFKLLFLFFGLIVV